jgi:hypothetical protein
MSTKPSVIERAFQLAKSGRCATVADIRAQLLVEDYDSAAGAVRGTTLVSRLDGMIKTARAPRRA